jgi:hypothetical protein
MPIEIRELHIKAVIDAGGGKKSDSPGQTGLKTGEQGEGGNIEQIIDLCVEKVLEILKDKQER